MSKNASLREAKTVVLKVRTWPQRLNLPLLRLQGRAQRASEFERSEHDHQLGRRPRLGRKRSLRLAAISALGLAHGSVRLWDHGEATHGAQTAARRPEP